MATNAPATPPLHTTSIPAAEPWFQAWAASAGCQDFAQLVEEAELLTFIEGSETPLTLFVPCNEAIRKASHKLPSGGQLLRELICVHIAMGSLRCASSRTHGSRTAHTRTLRHGSHALSSLTVAATPTCS